MEEISIYPRGELSVVVDEEDRVISYDRTRESVDNDSSAPIRRVSAGFILMDKTWYGIERGPEQSFSGWRVPFITEHVRGAKELSGIETYRKAMIAGYGEELLDLKLGEKVPSHRLNLVYTGIRVVADCRKICEEEGRKICRAMLAFYVILPEEKTLLRPDKNEIADIFSYKDGAWEIVNDPIFDKFNIPKTTRDILKFRLELVERWVGHGGHMEGLTYDSHPGYREPIEDILVSAPPFDPLINEDFLGSFFKSHKY